MNIPLSQPDSAFFSSSTSSNLFEMYNLDPNNIPHHVAIIMDGNRRWAKEQGVPFAVGHWKGAEAINHVVRMASQLGIKVITIYAFSTENWNRPSEEIAALMLLFQTYLMQQKEPMVQEGVRLDSIGDLTRLPEAVCTALEEVKNATKHCDRIQLVLALNYGGRDDIIRGIKKVFRDMKEDVIHPEELTEQMFCTYLDTAKWPDPDLLIRTSGEKRLSNFLLWQLSYTEVVLTDILWPDFSPYDLVRAIKEYQQRQRRKGGI